MKNKNLIVIGVIVILVIVGGGYFFLSSKNESDPRDTEPVAVEETIETLSPEEIGLELSTTNNDREVVISISKPEGIDTIEYELTWGAKVKDSSSGELLDVVHGISTEEPIELNGKPYETEIVMGSCSDVCHYDTGVNNIKIVLKVVKTDGKIYQVEETLEI